MEPCKWPENLSSHRKRAIEELIRGREFTTQLQAIIHQAPAAAAAADDDDDDDDDDNHGTTRIPTPTSSSSSSSSKTAEDLVSKILDSLNDSISMLMTSTETDEVLQELAASCDGRRSQDSSDSSKTSDRRGSYKRRRTSETWKKETFALIDDGHSWRKYGQKVILNAKHPRNYFRCSHKYDQSCQATKQVQKIQDDPPRFLTTYCGRHTCKYLVRAPQIIADDDDHDDKHSSSILLNFASNSSKSHKQSSTPPPPPSSFPSSSVVKQEIKEEFQSFCHSRELSDGYYLPAELTRRTSFEASEAMAAATFSSGSEHGDVISSGVYSCTPSPHSLEMDMMVIPVDFDDVLQFEF